MENASKALLIAGGILIAILIIGAVTFMFRDITEVQRTQEESKQIEQINEYNKQFAGYERTLYGHELLSLINKIINTNQKNAEQNKYINTSSGDGYDLIEIVVDGRRSYSLKCRPKSNDDLNNDTIKKFIGLKDRIMSTYRIAEKDFKAVADTNEKLQEAKHNHDTKKEKEIDLQYKELLKKYNLEAKANTPQFTTDLSDYKDYVDFKETRFNYTESKFSDKNGRINSMTFTER